MAKKTKAELEARVAELEEAEEAQAAPKEERGWWPGTCISCGQLARPIVRGEQRDYLCPLCGHEWGDAEERAPFRQGPDWMKGQ